MRTRMTTLAGLGDICFLCFFFLKKISSYYYCYYYYYYYYKPQSENGDSNQPEDAHSLIRVFVDHIKKRRLTAKLLKRVIGTINSAKPFLNFSDVISI